VDGVILHTDRGSEYTAARTTAACRALGVVQSTGRVGCALDNAAAEAFKGLAPITFERQMAQARRGSTAQLRAEVA